MIHREAVNAIVKLGYVVLEVEMPDGEWGYFIAHEFTPSTKTAVESIEYNTMVGVDITDFIHKRSVTFAQIDFSRSLDEFLSSKDTNVITLEMSNNTRWYKWKNLR